MSTLVVTPTLLTDGYKIDHRRQYPKETKTVVANMTPRKSRVNGIDKVVVYDLQAYVISTLIEIWNTEFFEKDIDDISTEFLQEMTEYTLNIKFAEDIGVEHWKALHKLGYLPLEIKALPEGTLCPIRVPFYTVKNTHPDFYWLTNYIETDMSAEVWGGVTSATSAFQFMKIFRKYAILTGGDLGFTSFQGHDFSYRGMFGRHAAQLSGSGHLTSFYGTDTIPAIKFLKKYYGADPKKEIIGCSVFATEHAVMCVTTGFYIKKNGLNWERYGEAEFEVFKRLITEVYPTGIVSIVSDTWNLWKVLVEYLPKLKNEILAREGKLVIRPDSGDPVDILTGEGIARRVIRKENLNFLPAGTDFVFLEEANDEKQDIYTKVDNDQEYKPFEYLPKHKGVIELLWDTFGGTVTSKGFRLLDPHIGAIYGDAITTERAINICERLMAKNFASTNWVAGIGSYTYTYVTRDTFGMAQKSTYAEVEIDNEIVGIEIFKDPITDDGTKKSAKGLVAVFKDKDGNLYLKDQCTWEEEQTGELQVIFRNSKLYNVQTIHEIRERLRAAAD
jgi:nicotinamide phosphoribosyltransferase